jgi:hypothetical protein
VKRSERGTCADCLWWRDGHAGWNQGICQRHAPRLCLEDGMLDWSVTRRDDFCGDFEKADPEEDDNDGE